MVPFTTRPVIMGTHGVVAAGHYLAAEIGARVLQGGGNAVDAGVAAGFALNLLKPHANGIAGEAPILIHRAGEGPGLRIAAINGQGTAPRRATIEWFHRNGVDAIPGDGLLPVVVPSAFGAWVTALIHYGRLDLCRTLGPAVELAREGFPVYPHLLDRIARHAERFRQQWPTSAELFLHDGRVPRVGWILKQPAWARTLQKVLDLEIRERHRGREAALQAALDFFYRGEIAEKLVAFASSTELLDATGRKHRGLLAMEDFVGFRTRIEEPATANYRGIDVYKCGPWSQGPVFLQQLMLLEGFDLAALGHNTPWYIHTVVEAAKLAFADRERYYGDPDFVQVPLDRLLSKEYAARRRKLIDPEVASPDLRPGDAPAFRPKVVPGDPHAHLGDTTHVDAVDAEGNMFSATPSGGWLAASPPVRELGIALNQRGQQFYLDPDHPDALAPGKRPRTTLTPSLAMKGGRPHMVFGTPGGDTQDQTSLQFFLNVVEFGMDLQAAIDAPNFHSEHFPSSFYPHTAHPRRLVMEGRIPPAVREALAAKGHDVKVDEDWGGVQQVSAVRFDPDTGLIEGAASPRDVCAYAIGR